jgi:RNA polymerase sigma factor (sigma-70 family)
MESDIPQRDDELVQKCLSGSEEAWGTLIDKYKNLIFSIPVKYGFRTDEADEIFQDVCLALLIGLPQLRKRQALAAWLIQTTSHRCFHWKRQRQRHVATEFDELFSSRETEKMPENILREAEREQMLREALSELRPRCHDLIRMRFFQEPPVPYEEVARKLNVATGSIGFLRELVWERCGSFSRKKDFGEREERNKRCSTETCHAAFHSPGRGEPKALRQSSSPSSSSSHC